MDQPSDGLAGLGGGRGRLELGWQGERGMVGAASSIEVSTTDDDDDGCGGTVQNKMEKKMERGNFR